MRWHRRRVAGALRRFLRIAVEVRGDERLPAGLPLILAANHSRRELDPLLLALVTPRALTFVSAPDLRRRPLTRLAERLGEVLYVSGDTPLAFEFVRACERSLERGRVLVIFPEGVEMGGGFGLFRHGAAYLALRSHAAIQPVWIDRSRWRRVYIEFGTPILPERAAMNRRSLEDITTRLQVTMLALRPNERREAEAAR